MDNAMDPNGYFTQPMLSGHVHQNQNCIPKHTSHPHAFSLGTPLAEDIDAQISAMDNFAATNAPEGYTPQGNGSGHQSEHLTYRSYQELKMKRKVKPLFTCPVQDTTIPRTHNDVLEAVKKVRDAIKDTSQALDSRKGPYVVRWMPDSTYYTPIDFEEVAWNIVEFAIKLHTKGWTRQVNDPNLKQQLVKEKDLSFADRISNVMELVRVCISSSADNRALPLIDHQMSKSCCDYLMKNEKLDTYIGAPVSAAKTYRINKHANDRRPPASKARDGIELLEKLENLKQEQQEQQREPQTEQQQPQQKQKRTRRKKLVPTTATAHTDAGNTNQSVAGSVTQDDLLALAYYDSQARATSSSTHDGLPVTSGSS
jgi:hypothetical protein